MKKWLPIPIACLIALAWSWTTHEPAPKEIAHSHPKRAEMERSHSTPREHPPQRHLRPGGHRVFLKKNENPSML